MPARASHFLLLIIAAFTFNAIAAPAGPEFGGAPDLVGFRGMKWGASASEFPGLTRLKSDAFVQRYSRDDEQLQIGGVKLKSIIYNFYKGRFMGVSIRAQGADKWNGLKKIIFENFGQTTNVSARKSSEQYEWRARRSITHLQYFKKTGLVKLWIVSAEIPGLQERGRQ